MSVLDVAAHGRGADVVTICAPAGSGKSTLLGRWQAACDAIPSRVLVIVRPTVGGDAGRWLWRPLAAALADRSDTGTAVAEDGPGCVSAIGMLAARGVSTVVVVDDADQLEPAGRAALSRLMRDSPARFCLVLAASWLPILDPPIPSVDARWTPLGFADIALDRESVRAVFADAGVAPADEDLDELWRRTWGWAAMVTAAARASAVSAASDRGDLFAPGWRAGLASLARDTFAAVSPAERELLQVFAICAEAPAELLLHLYGPTMLEDLRDLMDRGFPLGVVDHVGALPGYSCPPVLREVLAESLATEDPAGVRALHSRVAAWLEAEGHLFSALTHHVAAGGALESVVLRLGMPIVFDGISSAMFDRLGEEGEPAALALQLWRALEALERFEADEAIMHLALAGPGAEAGPAFARAWAALSLEAAVIGGRPLAPGVIEDLDLAIDSGVSCGVVDIDCYVLIHRAMALMLCGDLVGSERLLRRALALEDLGAHPCLILRAKTRLAGGSTLAEDLGAMSARAAAGLEYAETHNLLDRIDAHQCVGILALRAYLAGEDMVGHDAVANLVARPEVRCRRDGTHFYVAGNHTRLMVGLFAARQTVAPDEKVIDDLRKDAEAVLVESAQPALTQGFVPEVIAVLLEEGRMVAARALLDRAEAALGPSAGVQVARGMLALAAGDGARARAEVAPVLGAEAAVEPVTILRAYLIEAQAAHRLGEVQAVLAGMDHALEHAELSGVVRPFLGGDQVLLELVRQAAARCRRPSAFLRAVTVRMRAYSGVAAPTLTAAEMAVVDLLPSGRTIPQIGAALHLSANTVKTHLRSIYQKLEVRSRAEAIDAALRAGLL